MINYSQRDIAKQEIQAATKVLKEHLGDMVTTISIDDFKTKVLPILTTRGEDFNIAAWIEVVGHPQVGLRVYDNNGEVKYDIPPFYRSVKSHNNKGIDNISAAANHFTHIRSQAPIPALNMLNRAMSEYAPHNSPEKNVEDSDAVVTVLNQIYRDFGYDDLIVETISTKHDKSVIGSSEENIIGVMDDGEYDEL